MDPLYLSPSISLLIPPACLPRALPLSCTPPIKAPLCFGIQDIVHNDFPLPPVHAHAGTHTHIQTHMFSKLLFALSSF